MCRVSAEGRGGSAGDARAGLKGVVSIAINFTSEEQAREAIEEWRDQSAEAQLIKLKKATEALELNQMYYENKGSEKAARRVVRILDILRERRSALEGSGKET